MIPFGYGDQKVPDRILMELYKKTSKHSQYQKIPEILADHVDINAVSIHSRYEDERFAYVSSKMEFEERTILDIGGNTGYFALRCAEDGAHCVDYYDANMDHAEFVKRAAALTGYDERIKIHPQCYDFIAPNKNRYDICLLMNVLHHIGDDFDDRILEVSSARECIIDCLVSMSRIADIMVFQMGFNLQGDIRKPLFTNGTKQEMIDYVKDNCSECWDILFIGIAEKRKQVVRYYDLNDGNAVRDDSLGEFLNRPLFILKSRHFNCDNF